MSTDARDPGADPALPFGAGLRPETRSTDRSEPRGARGSRARSGPRTAHDRSPGGAPAALGADAPDLGTFLDADGGAPLGTAGARALCASAAGAFSGAELRDSLERAMGPAATDPRFKPTPDEVSAAFLGGQPLVIDGGVSGVDAVAVVVQPSEPFAHLGARVLQALASATRVALIGHPDLPSLGPRLTAALREGGVEPWRLAAFDRADGAALGEIAGRPSVALDLIDFDPVEGRTLDRLRRLRALAAAEAVSTLRPSGRDRVVSEGTSAAAGAEAAAGADPWFGLGAVDRPPMPILVRRRLSRQASLGVEADPVDAALPEGDLAEAAELVVEQAFGRGALGGFASDAVTSVLIRPDLFSAFTACLLETLEETDEDPWFAPPPWVQRDPRSQALRDLAGGRRRVLDEGATLIHERRLARQAPCGLVFTNVEPRMKLAGEMSVPGALFLVRALDTR